MAGRSTSRPWVSTSGPEAPARGAERLGGHHTECGPRCEFVEVPRRRAGARSEARLIRRVRPSGGRVVSDRSLTPERRSGGQRGVERSLQSTRFGTTVAGHPRRRARRVRRGRFVPTRNALLLSVVAAAAAVAIASCSGPPTPSGTLPSRTVALGIEVWRAPDPMLQFFGSEVHARLSGEGWTTEWIVPDGPSSTDVPSGAVTLEMWTVVRGDTLTCAPDPATARESCYQPIIGNGQTCSLAMDLAPDDRVSIRFSLLAQERCQLAGGAQ
jgi:hypothetical protein